MLKSTVERQSLREVRRLSGHVHEPAFGLDGQVEPRRRCELARPDACGEDDAVGVDPSTRGLDPGDAAALDEDPFHRAGLLHAGAEPGRPLRAALHDEIGRHRPRNRVEDCAAEIVDRKLGHDLPRLVRLECPRVDAGVGLVHEVGLEPLDIGGVVEEEEVAVEAEVELLADLLLEPL